MADDVANTATQLLPDIVRRLAIEDDLCGVREWLDGGGHLNARSEDEACTLLMLASRSDIEYGSSVQEMLLKRGASLNLQDDEGWSALMHAAYYGRPINVQRLLRAGAKMNLRDYLTGSDALQLSNGEDPYLFNENGGCAKCAQMIRTARAVGRWDSLRHWYRYAVTLVRWCEEVIEKHNRPDGRGAALAEAEFRETANAW